MNEKIDFVITWVDGNDPVWQAEKKKYDTKAGDSRITRYRDWGTLRYWFRGVERYAPWVGNIYFVTYGHKPDWLNVNHPKLIMVNHKDFIPEKYLPTFSCRPIELNLHRINGLSDRFVYFNDDMFLLQPVTESDFFINGLPCETAVLTVSALAGGEAKKKRKTKFSSLYTALAFNCALINRNFEKNKVIMKNWYKWFNIKYGSSCLRTLLLMPWNYFSGIMNYHIPYSYLKSTYEEVWAKEKDILDLTCSHKFRMMTDVSQTVMNFWQCASGNFMPRNPHIGKALWLRDDKKNNEIVFDTIRKQSYKMICVSDEVHEGSFNEIKSNFLKTFESIFPEKSSFEV